MSINNNSNGNSNIAVIIVLVIVNLAGSSKALKGAEISTLLCPSPKTQIPGTQL